MDMVDQPVPKDEVRDLLVRHRIAGAEELVAADGVANAVWLTPKAIIRLNGGRFRNAFRHEADVLTFLPAEIPHPEVIAFGHRDEARGEYLILARIPGRTAAEAWSDMDDTSRERMMRDLATITRTLHEMPMTPAMRNPWVEEAISTPILGDAYHAPPSFAQTLIDGARSSGRSIRPDLESLLGELERFIHARGDACANDGADGLVHADLHLRNVLVHNGRISGIIDFEGCRPARADVELDTLVRFFDSPRQFGGSRRTLETSPHEGALGWYRAGYPELFAHPRLIERLEVYEALWHLVQLYNWRPEYVAFSDPATGLRALLRGDARSRFVRLLA